MMRHEFFLKSGTAMLALGMFAAAPAFAQSASGEETTASEEGTGTSGLEEIIVTAQRRSESLQDVPISITAISGGSIADSAIRGVDEIAGRTPGFTMTAQNVAQPRMFIRGIGSTGDGAAEDNSVAIFVDDVYVGRGAGQAFEFLDIERIEVLRGPQGTLYGKNVVGGLINVISAKPKRTFDAAGEVAYGNYNSLDLRGYVTGPVSDTLSASLSTVYRSHDGFARNIRLNRDLEDLKTVGIRAQLLWQPTSDIDLLLSADYNNHEDNGQSRKGEGPFSISPFGNVGQFQTTADPRESESPRETFQKRDIYGITGRADWRMGLGTVTSITAFRANTVDLADAFTGIGSPPYPVLHTLNGIQEDAHQFSQEVRLALDPFWNDRLTGVAGVYYLKEKVDHSVISDLDSVIGSNNPALGGLTGISGSFQKADTESLGVFGSLTWNITDSLGLTGGLRYSRDTKDIRTEVRSIADIDAIIAAPPTEEYLVTASDNWSAFTPRVALTYEVSQALNLYASYSQGFKSGGFQGQAATAAAARSPFNPEHAKSFEVGAKGRLFQNRLSFALSAHSTRYEDLQVRQNSQRPGDPLPVLRITNAGEARARGIELDINAKPVEWLSLWGSYGYLDAKYVKFVDNLNVDRAGNQMAYAPRNTYNIGGQVDLPLGKLTGYGRAEYRWQDTFYYDPANNLINTQKGYGLLSGAIGARIDEGRFSVELWGKNLTNRLYTTHIIPFFGDRFATYGPPRTYGIRARFSY